MNIKIPNFVHPERKKPFPRVENIDCKDNLIRKGQSRILDSIGNCKGRLIKIIAVSGLAEKERFAEEASREGAQAFLLKPDTGEVF